MTKLLANSTEAGLPSDEIEVTRAMIEAGLAVLRRFDPERDFDEPYVVRIWRAMIAANKPDCHGDYGAPSF